MKGKDPPLPRYRTFSPEAVLERGRSQNCVFFDPRERGFCFSKGRPLKWPSYTSVLCDILKMRGFRGSLNNEPETRKKTPLLWLLVLREQGRCLVCTILCSQRLLWKPWLVILLFLLRALTPWSVEIPVNTPFLKLKQGFCSVHEKRDFPLDAQLLVQVPLSPALQVTGYRIEFIWPLRGPLSGFPGHRLCQLCDLLRLLLVTYVGLFQKDLWRFF